MIPSNSSVLSLSSNKMLILNQSAELMSHLVMHPVQSDVPEHEEQFLVFNDEDDGFLKYLNIGSRAPHSDVTHIVVISYGLLGALLSTLVFSRPQMASSIYTLLAAVEIANFFIYATFLPEIFRERIPSFAASKESVSLFKATTYAQLASVFISNWTTVLVSFWRYVGHRWPTRAYNWCSRSRSHLALALVFSSAIILAIPASLLFAEQEVKFFAYDRSTKAYYSTSIFRPILSDLAIANGGILMTVNRIILILTTTIPCLFLTVATILSVTSLWAARKTRQRLFNLEDLDKFSSRKITLMLVAVLSTYMRFMVSYLPDVVANVALLFVGDGSTLESDHLKLFREEKLIMLANCLNFFANYYLNESFQKTFANIFCFRSKSRATLPSPLE